MQLTHKPKTDGKRSGARSPEERFTFKAGSARSLLCHVCFINPEPIGKRWRSYALSRSHLGYMRESR
jgi:hypothetical protein